MAEELSEHEKVTLNLLELSLCLRCLDSKISCIKCGVYLHQFEDCMCYGEKVHVCMKCHGEDPKNEGDTNETKGL